MEKRPLIIDCDTGEDDAIALVLTAYSKLPLKYIFTCHGNTTLQNATENSARIMSLVGASDVKVIAGASKPTTKHLWEKEGFTVGEDFIGRNGICNIELPKSNYDNISIPGEERYVEEMAKAIESCGPVDYIITGPATNFAQLCDYFGSDIKKHINSLTIMGGAIYVRGTRGGGVRNVGFDQRQEGQGLESWAEFNFYCDPAAIKKTLAAGFNPIVVTWDACIHYELSLEYINRMRSNAPGGKFVCDLMQAFMKLFGIKNKTHFEVCDPITIMAFLGYGNLRDEKVNVITERHHFGKCYPDPEGYPIRYFHTNEKEKDEILADMMRRLEIELSE
ncbi:MAG: nucleoside hydrolase [Deltaproteobacteria bacterium]|nr:nucleoside hydrolase [Deltaproteobacteria bacterium]